MALGLGLALIAASAPAPAAQTVLIARDTPVEIEFTTTLSSASAKAGEAFAFRLAAPILLGGREVVPAGAMGTGEIIEAKPAAGSGVPGVLILALRSLDHGGQTIPLYRLQQGEVGLDRVDRANATTRYGRFSVLPTALLAMAETGQNIMMPAGGRSLARVARDTLVRPVAAAPAQPPAAAITPLPETATLSVPAPPRGKGQVVFFRPSTLNWAAIGCTVKEEGRKVSSLGNGRWFAVLVEPGVHGFTADSETKDSLHLNVEEGETQFVACRMRMSVLLARPYIRPVPSGAFHGMLSGLRLVGDDDMAGAGVLRRDQIRYALAERGDVRGRSPYGAMRGDTKGERVLDRTTEGIATATATAAAREAGVGVP